MAMSRQRFWGSVVEDFVRHKDWKYRFQTGWEGGPQACPRPEEEHGRAREGGEPG